MPLYIQQQQALKTIKHQGWEMKIMSNRNYYKYHHKKGRKVVHSGITDDLERREKEHQAKYGKSSHIFQVGRAVTEKSARKWEEERGLK